MRVGRNDKCPCGSGQKSKNCCAGKSDRGVSKGLIALFVVIAVVAAVGLIPRDEANASRPMAAAAGGDPTARPGSPQPGPAPAGKVWSQEHGHWHDAPKQIPIQVTPQTGVPVAATGSPAGAPGQAPAPQITTPQAPVPQPDGPVPPGKVWSPEHGHWHDKPAAQQ